MNNPEENTALPNSDVGEQRKPRNQRPRNSNRPRSGNGQQSQPNNIDAQDYEQDGNTYVNNSRGRGGLRRGRGQGRFGRGLPFLSSYFRTYENDVNGSDGYYGASYPTRRGALNRDDGYNNNNNNSNVGRGNRRRNRPPRTENPADVNETRNKPKQEQDNAVTNGQPQNENNKGSARGQRRRPPNTPRQNGPRPERPIQTDSTGKPLDDETIVRILLRNMVSKVARRIARRNQRQIRASNQETTEKNTDPELRKTRRRGQGRPRNDNAAEQGNNDPSNDTPTANRGRGSGGRGRGGRGGGRGGNRRSDEANKENQPQAKPVEEKAPGTEVTAIATPNPQE